MTFNSIVTGIKRLKIQGAENIAKEAAIAIFYVLKHSKAKDAPSFIKELENSRKILFSTRPTEPCMRNTINYILSSLKREDSLDTLKKSVINKIKSTTHFFEESERKIARTGAEKIKEGMVVFTHCHSSTVVNILKQARKQGKYFTVCNTETRPLFQGRKTAIELAEAGIPVIHFVDSAARLALKKADIMLIGSDAITAEGAVINKIGSELMAETAKRFGIPVYACTHSWKFDKDTISGNEVEIEKRDSKEIWEKPPKGVKVLNPAFERVNPNLIAAVISELGVHSPHTFVEEVQKSYPLMFS